MAAERIEEFKQIFGSISIERQSGDRGENPIVDPINIKLQKLRESSQRHGTKLLKPRDYQRELYLHTLQHNTIIYLGTGLGKTLIVVMFITSPYLDEQIQQGRKVVFMAPTQDLVKQQAEYVSTKCPYKSRVYCGRTCQLGTHIDHWSKDIWTNELETIDLMFMTPQIFCSAISSNLLRWENFSAVVFDEVHHAARPKKNKQGSPYYQLLNHYKQYYEVRSTVRKPRLLGLTASLINNQPKTSMCVVEQVKYMERQLGAKCVTDTNVMETRPRMVTHLHSAVDPSDFGVIIDLLKNFSAKLKPVIATGKAKYLLNALESSLDSEERQTLAYLNRLKLASSGFSIKPFSFGKILNQLAAICQNCGLWCLANILYLLVVALKNHSNNRSVALVIRPIYKDLTAYFMEILKAIGIFLGPVNFESRNFCRNLLLTYTSPKLLALLDVLANEHRLSLDAGDAKNTFSCIIFVRSRVEVLALSNWIQNVSSKFPEYNFIKSDFAVGLAATLASKWACITKRKPNTQSRMLDDFRKGHLNTIVTTSVLEEGIDLPVCSTVIRYDEAPTFRVYVQSRGRARQKVSSYVSLCTDEKQFSVEDRLHKFNDFEYRVKELLQGQQINQLDQSSHTPESRAPPSPLDTHDKFVLNDGAICLTGSQARIVLNMYCCKLLSGRSYTTGIQYEHHKPTENSHRITLYLPPGCPIRTGITGNEKCTPVMAANSAIVEALRLLYEAGELDENAVPQRRAVNVDRILTEKGLRPILEPLPEELEGKVIQAGDGGTKNEFPAQASYLEGELSRNCKHRSYKLIKIDFRLGSETSREETRHFFTESRFGLVIDSDMPENFIPKKLHGHYAQLEVTSTVIDGNLKIDNLETHYRYLKFTHQLLTRCLRLGFIDERRFRRRCLFYLVLLDQRNQIATQRMQQVFWPSNTSFRAGDVVKLRRNFCKSKFDARKVYLVRNIDTGLNATSAIPGLGKCTFIEHTERSYGRGVIRDFRQPAIEVQQISTQVAQTRLSKRVDRPSRPIYLLVDLLEHFSDDAACVFQAFNFPEIVYRIYFARATLDLNANFLQATSHRRQELVQTQGGSEEESSVQPEGAQDGRGGDHDAGLDGEDGVPMDEAEEDDYGNDERGSNDSSSDSDESSDSSQNYDDADDDEELPPLQPLNLPVQREANLNKLGEDKDEMEEWDLSQYNPPDLKTLTFQRSSSHYLSKSLTDGHNYDEAFGLLSFRAEPFEDSIISGLESIQKGFKGDTLYLDDDKEFSARRNRVDVSVEPPIKLDKSDPKVDEHIVMPLLEALTLRCSGEKYNLEVLENIGDSYLKYFVSVVLFKELDCEPAYLSSARSDLTSNRTFNHLAKARRLGSYAITRSFDTENLVKLLDGAVIYNQLRPKDLADMFESIIGSYLLHRGEYEAVLAIEWLGLNLVRDETFSEFRPNEVAFKRAPTALISSEDETTRSYYESYKARAKRFQSIVCYKFNDISYLVQAFTHASAPQKCTNSYERLELLGDAVLDYLVVRTLVARLESTDRAKSDNFRLTPGQLSTSKSALVNNKTFAKLALQYCYDFFIHHTNQEILDELDRVHIAVKEDKDFKFLDLIDFDQISKLLADVFEAVAGAIYLDSGCSLDKVWAVYYPMMKPSFDEEVANPTKNVVANLYETFPGPKRISFDFFKVESIEGVDTVGVKCAVYGLGEFLGEGLSKQQAKHRAIVEALKHVPPPEKLERLNKEYIDAHRTKHTGDRRSNRSTKRQYGATARGDSRQSWRRREPSQRDNGQTSDAGRRYYSGRR